MFPIKNIRDHVTNRLDEIEVLREFSCDDQTLEIIETEGKKSPDRKKDETKELLNEVHITNIPESNIWIFENEFEQQEVLNELIDSQKGAFSSAGKKVEKTILFHSSGRLYLIMIEMKRTISPVKMQKDVVKKFESSLSTLSVFISSHNIFPELIDDRIYPIGVCCYNYYDDNNSTHNNDYRRTTGKVRKDYAEGNRLIPLQLEPLGLNRMVIPVLFFENPNRNPVSQVFEIDFEEIINKI